MVTHPKPHIDEHKNFVSIKKRASTDYLVVHCSATRNLKKYDWKTIDQIHRQQGWLMIGYHFVITSDGVIQNGRDIDSIGSHVKGHNDNSLGICLIGGVDAEGNPVDNFTPAQKKALKELLDYLLSLYPNAKVQGHRDFPNVAKDCPCFDVKQFYKPAVYIKYEGQDLKDITKLSNADLKAYNGTLDYQKGDLVRVK